MPKGTIADWVSARNRLQENITKTSGIPVSFSNEALHSAVTGGTIFPELVTQGSSWDPELIENISAAVAAPQCGQGSSGQVPTTWLRCKAPT